MSTDSVAKAKISIKEGLIELEGSEGFVREQLQQYMELLKITDINIENVEKPVLNGSTPSSDMISETSYTVDEFVNHFGVREEVLNKVIHTDKDNFTIITTKIKGTKADKQVNYCLMFCLAKEFYDHQTVPYKELRDLCEYFDCLDENNFASILTRNKSYFIIDGEKRSPNKNVKLTAPGKEEARKLISSLVGE